MSIVIDQEETQTREQDGTGSSSTTGVLQDGNNQKKTLLFSQFWLMLELWICFSGTKIADVAVT